MMVQIECVEKKVTTYIEKIEKFFQGKDKYIAAGCLFILGITLIPLYMYGFYTVPYADDYSMVLETHEVWTNTHSIWQVLLAAVATATEYYMTWTGAFSNTFLQALLPGLGSFKWYFLASWFLLTVVVLGSFYLGKVIFCEVLEASKSCWLIFTSIVVFYQIQHMPYLYDAFYWYVGGLAYMLPYAVKLIYIGRLLHHVYARNSGKKLSVVNIILFALFTVFVAALDEACTSTPMVIVLFLIFLYGVSQNKGKSYVIISLGIYLLTWMLCVAAPGNMARQGFVGKRNGIIYSIIEALFAGTYYISLWTGIRVILFSLVLLPIIVYAVKKSNVQFRHPAICVLMTYGIFSAPFAPRVYANYGDVKDVVGYTLNFIHCLYVLMWVVNLVYLTGWVVKNICGNRNEEKKTSFSKVVYYFSILVTIIMLFGGGIFLKGEYASVKVVYNLYKGYAQTYMDAMLEREKLMYESEGQDVVVDAIPLVFATSGGGDISEDADLWINAAVSKYYHLNSIRIQSN